MVFEIIASIMLLKIHRARLFHRKEQCIQLHVRLSFNWQISRKRSSTARSFSSQCWQLKHQTTYWNIFPFIISKCLLMKCSTVHIKSHILYSGSRKSYLQKKICVHFGDGQHCFLQNTLKLCNLLLYDINIQFETACCYTKLVLCLLYALNVVLSISLTCTLPYVHHRW
jgi:hypothetical protein